MYIGETTLNYSTMIYHHFNKDRGPSAVYKHIKQADLVTVAKLVMILHLGPSMKKELSTHSI